MNVIEKRGFIHSYLHRANENIINEFYEKLRKEDLKLKPESKALKSKKNIESWKVFSRAEIEQATNTDF
jgi:hypothetical protein